MRFYCFHSEEFDASRNGEKCDYLMTEEVLDTGLLLLTCPKCKREVFAKPEAEGMSFNSTTVFYSDFTATGIGLTVMIAVGMLLISLTVLPIFERFQLFFSKMGRIFLLSIKGGGITIAGYGIYLGSQWLMQFGEYVDFQLIWVVYGVAGFAGLVCLGYAGEKVYGRILSNYHIINQEEENPVG